MSPRSSSRIPTLFAIAVVVASALGASETADTERASALLAEAHEHLVAGDNEAAITKLEAVDRMADGESADALLLLAIAKNNVERSDEAIEHAEDLLDLDPGAEKAADAYFQLGIARLQKASPEKPGKRWKRRDLERAEEALRSAVELNGPRAHEAKAHLGHVLVRRALHTNAPASYLQEGIALALERYEEGSPGSGMDVALYVLCGSATCVPPHEAVGNDTFEEPVTGKLLHQELLESDEGIVEKPVKLSSSVERSAAYAQRMGVRGKVVIQAIIDKDGSVANLRVLQGLPFGVSGAAAEDVRQWRFEPGTLNGEPVNLYYNLTITYR